MTSTHRASLEKQDNCLNYWQYLGSFHPSLSEGRVIFSDFESTTVIANIFIRFFFTSSVLTQAQYNTTTARAGDAAKGKVLHSALVIAKGHATQRSRAPFRLNPCCSFARKLLPVLVMEWSGTSSPLGQKVFYELMCCCQVSQSTWPSSPSALGQARPPIDGKLGESTALQGERERWKMPSQLREETQRRPSLALESLGMENIVRKNLDGNPLPVLLLSAFPIYLQELLGLRSACWH